MFDPVLFAALMGSTALFSPSSLFSAGEQGAWYDPSDLDRYMSGLGTEGSPALSEYVTVLTGTWAASGANYIFTDTVGGQSRPGVQYPTTSLVAGWYRVVVVVAAINGATQIRMDGVGAADQLLTVGTNTYTLNVTSTSRPRFRLEDLSTTIGDSFTITSISIKEVTSVSSATMFQDSAGTTPVTAVEQPVGLLLDKSKGLALGSERITNGGFDSTAWWGVDAGWSISGGVATNTGADQIYTPLTTLEANKRYEISFDVTSVTTSGALVVVVGVTNVSLTVASTGRYTLRAADATGGRLRFGSGTGHSWRGSIDNVTVKEIAGNHASQSTAASRPVLSARVNQLTYSEQFDNAAWTKSNVVISANAITAPDGALTGDKLYPLTTGSNRFVYQPLTLASGLYRFSVRAKAGEKSILYIDLTGAGTTQAFFDLSTGTVGSVSAGYSAIITSLGNGWFECSATNNSPSSYSFGGVYGVADANGSTSVTASGTSGIYIWGADLRVTNVGVGLPAYQRVAAATDYDTSGFPLYLKFDGVDDTLLGPSISNVISASDYEACIGARFITVTTNTSPWLNHSLITDAGGYVGVGAARSTGTVNAYNFDTAQDEASVAMTAPATIVLQQRHTGGEIAISTNGGAEGTAASGNTNPISNQMQIMKASGAVYTNGHIYGGIIRSTVFSNSERVAVRTWINNLTKAY